MEIQGVDDGIAKLDLEIASLTEKSMSGQAEIFTNLKEAELPEGALSIYNANRCGKGGARSGGFRCNGWVSGRGWPPVSCLVVYVFSVLMGLVVKACFVEPDRDSCPLKGDVCVEVERTPLLWILRGECSRLIRVRAVAGDDDESKRQAADRGLVRQV